jgi:hypothetical protein
MVMRIRFRYLAAAGAVAAMFGAPAAAAEDGGQRCTDLSNTATECSTPGNVQINDSPPTVGEAAFPWAYPGPYPVPYDEGTR